MATPIPTTLPPGIVSIRRSLQIPLYMPAGTEWWIATDSRGGQQGMTPADYQWNVSHGYFSQPNAEEMQAQGYAWDTYTQRWYAPGETTPPPPANPYGEGVAYPGGPTLPGGGTVNVTSMTDTQASAGLGGAARGQTAAQKAATMLYNAMRGLPFISPEFLTALQAGQAPVPRTVTPQTLAALSADSTLSDAFFSVIKANALYPESYLAEIGRYIPRGREATPSFI